MGDRGPAETLLVLEEGGLVRGGKDHGEGAGGEVSRARLAGRVDNLGGEDAAREIRADDDEVREGISAIGIAW